MDSENKNQNNIPTSHHKKTDEDTHKIAKNTSHNITEKKNSDNITENQKDSKIKEQKDEIKKIKKQNEEIDLDKKREELISFIKQKKHYFQYILLAIIIYIGSSIRTKSISNLIDNVTGKYIPLALDPHLFYRYAHYILEHGSLFATDFGRFTPEGISTIRYLFMSEFLVYLYKVWSFIFPSATLDYVVIIYPVVCFAIALVFFFLLSRELFDSKIALLSTLFLAIIPSFLQRTIAGFSDHEALGVMLMFMALYVYFLAWKTKSIKYTALLSFLAGIFTGMMGQSWGGWKFLLLMISGYTLIEFFFDKITTKDFYQYLSWTIGYVLVVSFWIPIYSIGALLSSFTTGIAFLVLGILILNQISKLEKIQNLIQKQNLNIPHALLIALIASFFGIIAIFTVIGTETIFSHAQEISNNLLHPLGNNRWELTVAEQHQPYFTEWISSFGPNLLGTSKLPIYLLLFMSGAIIIFYQFAKKLRYRNYLTAIFTLFLMAFTMSRYSASSTFNGVNTISIATYLGSLAIFILIMAAYYLYSYYKDKENYEKILQTDKKYIFLLVWFLIMVVAARGAIRLFFIFTPITAILASYSFFSITDKIIKLKQQTYKIIALALIFFFILSPFASPLSGVIPTFYKQSVGQATYTGPGYSYQWQLAGEWVRENIPEDAIFSHWWDYGYWVQTGWERSTVLDGTNKITYWNYLMGRYVMTGQTQTEALEFLNVHESTHFLVVPEEIGKYTAYSSIGSDENYDRYSWITTFSIDESLTTETRENTILGFRGGQVLDADLVINDKIYPTGSAAIGGIFLPIKFTEQTTTNGEIAQGLTFEKPYVALIYAGTQTEVPLNCLFVGNEMVIFDDEGLIVENPAENEQNYLTDNDGIGGCFVLLPDLTANNDPTNSDISHGLYLSEKGVTALWSNLYILNQKNPYYDTSAFELTFDQSSSWAPLGMYEGRLVGPIKIWEINYPEGFSVDEETRADYLAHNEKLPDYFFDVN